MPQRKRRGALEMAAGPSENDSVVEHEIRIAAAPETVFAYFTDPARMV